MNELLTQSKQLRIE